MNKFHDIVCFIVVVDCKLGGYLLLWYYRIFEIYFQYMYTSNTVCIEIGVFFFLNLKDALGFLIYYLCGLYVKIKKKFKFKFLCTEL